MIPSSDRRSPWRKIYALPTEHGSWIWWIGPLLLGTAAARHVSADLILLTASLLLAFLIRQPVILLVKIRSGRRSAADLPPVQTWLAIYGTLLAAAGLALIIRGHGRLLLLLLPGLPVFAWHLWLVSRREERGQRGIEIVGSGVLALAAPAAYWVSGGMDPALPWLLWTLSWLQSAASIVLVYLRLDQRSWKDELTIAGRLSAGSRTLAYYLVDTLASVALSLLGVLPWLLTLGFVLMLIDALIGVLQPAVGQRPTRIGLRQLLASLLFYSLAALAFAL
ncbi:MAG: YwiC-like family protein [Anaerolineales bacterium]|jgi:hypothetical protein